MASQDIHTTLYNGKYEVVYKDSSHRYTVDGTPRQGVTTIMSKVLAKDGLMLWPLNMALKYIRENGERRQGTRFLYISDDLLEVAAKAHIMKRDAGADTGSQVHALAERVLLDVLPSDYEVSQMQPEVALAIGTFIGWRANVGAKTLAVEQIVYSPTLDYTGTFDSILEIDGKVYLCDLKTTNASRTAPMGIYAENFIQLGAYYLAYEEQRQHELANGGTDLVKIDDLMIISCRKDGGLDTCSASQLGLSLDDCKRLWTNTINLHTTLTPIRKQLERII